MDIPAWRDDSDRHRPAEGLDGLLDELWLDELDLPHIVLCTDRDGWTTISGPHASALEAMVAADEQERAGATTPRSDSPIFRVTALYPAIGSMSGKQARRD